jgi:hypothetical protein
MLDMRRGAGRLGCIDDLDLGHVEGEGRQVRPGQLGKVGPLHGDGASRDPRDRCNQDCATRKFRHPHAFVP